MQKVGQHLRHSLLSLRKNPGLTAIVLLTLALGIGANTAIFTVDYATSLAPLPYREPDRIVEVWSKWQDDYAPVAAGDYRDWTQQATSFQDLEAVANAFFNVAGRDQPEYVQGHRVTVGYFRMLGQPFALGRNFLPEEATGGKDHVVILTHKQWQSLGSNPHIVGTTIHLDDEPYTVVGVLAAGAPDRGQAQVIVPLVFTPEQLNYSFHWLTVRGRLKPGVTIRQAEGEMDAVAARIADLHPERGKGWGVYVEPFKNDWQPDDRGSRTRMLWLLMGGVGFVLLIACVNIVNLLLAKNVTRQRELAVRGSLGATPVVIFGHLLTESLLLAVVGGVLGVVTGYAMLHALLAVMPPLMLPSQADLRLDPAVLLFTLGATTLAGLLVGCAPAWLASRVDPVEALKEGGRSSGGVGHQRLRQGLVIGEFALAIALLAGAGLAIHSFLNLERMTLGVRTDHVLTARLPVPDTRSKDPADIIAYYHRILASVEAIPGVSSAAASWGTPLRGRGFGLSFAIAGQPAYSDPAKWPFTAVTLVTPDYFKTYGIRLIKGRLLTEQDTRSAVRVAVVNETFAERFLKGVDPFQQRVVIDQIIPGVQKMGAPVEWQIVGIVNDVLYQDLRDVEPEVDVTLWQSPWPRATIAVRTSVEPQSVTKSLAAAVHAVDPDVAVADPLTLDQARSLTMSSDRFTFILFSSFAAIALLLASIGIYGVTAFSVSQRLREMAIRSALGATRRRVIGLVMTEGLTLAVTGLGVGLVGAYVVGRFMHALLYGVGAIDVPAFGLVGILLLAAALVACFVPAYRAASAEPLEALRSQ